jgi:hypothetical protein
MYRVSTLSADQSIEIRFSQDIYQILVQQGFEVLVSGSQVNGYVLPPSVGTPSK